jgi:ketosteroid isomerase-like protein
MIEEKKFLEAIPLFYTEDMTAQENGEALRVGRSAQVENESRAVAVLRYDVSRAASYVVDGDHVAIQWVFEMTLPSGAHCKLEEVAYQTWRADRIVNERYFYDPAQLKPLQELR